MMASNEEARHSNYDTNFQDYSMLDFSLHRYPGYCLKNRISFNNLLVYPLTFYPFLISSFIN